MPLVNLGNVQKDAINRKYGISASEIWDQFSTKAFIDAASETRSSIILIIDVPILTKLGIKPIIQMVKAYAEETDIPVVLHLDECQDPEIIFESILAGFPSVMFDGAELGLDIEENIKQTKEIVKFAHYMGVTVEASLGRMPLTIGGVTSNLKRQMVKTKLHEAERFCLETGIDNFAPSIGNYHGLYKETWPNPDFDLAKKIYTTTNTPMSAHGSTGISRQQIKMAIESGFVKFNTGTLYQEFYRKRIQEYSNKYEGYPSSFLTSWDAMIDMKEYLKDLIINGYSSNNRY